MEWRVRECGHGGFVAEYGETHKGGEIAPNGIGYTMSAFIVYQSAQFDKQSQAKIYIRAHLKGAKL